VAYIITMTIESTKLEKAVVLKVSGRMDAENADQFRKVCERLVSEGVLRVVADFAELDYVSSMGLRAIMAAAKALQERSGSMILCGLRGVPRQVFVMTNLLGLFSVFATSAEALATL